jgi:lipopolysaccharide transport system permease protein
MRDFPTTPREMAASLWRNRSLVMALCKREIAGRYRGSLLGMFWSFFHPVFMLAVYTFVFSVVFQARWGSGSGSKTEFALVLFAGLIVFNLFAECVNRSPALILLNVNYVKKVIFPLEILPWVTLSAALFHAGVSLFVWLVAYVLLFGLPHMTVLYVPLVIFPLCLFTVGISWALASLGVYLRDVAQVVGILTTVLMFLSPIFYPVTALPERYRPLLLLNPLMPVLEQVRSVLYFGNSPDWRLLGGCYLVMSCVRGLGLPGFRRRVRGLLMSSDIAISVENLSKCYEIYDRPRDRLMQMLCRGRRQYYREFWLSGMFRLR